MSAIDWSNPTLVGWVGNAIMGATLVAAVIIAVAAHRASSRASEFAARLMTSERRLKIRECLRESDDRDDLKQAFDEARDLFGTEPTELRIVERLYYCNPAIPLDEFSEAYAVRSPPQSLLEAVGQTLPQRFDGREMAEALIALRRYAHMTTPDNAGGLAYWRVSPPSLAAAYVTRRLEGQPYEPRLGPILRSFMDGPQSTLSHSILSYVANAHWEPLETKLVLTKLALTNLGTALRTSQPPRMAEIVRDTALRFFTESAIFDPARVTRAVEADALEGCALAGFDFIVYLTARDPVGAAEIAAAGLPKVEDTLKQLRNDWPHTTAAMLRRLDQFEPIYTWWNSRRTTLPVLDNPAVLAVTAALDRLYPPERHAERSRIESALIERLRDRPGRTAVIAAQADLGPPPCEEPARDVSAEEDAPCRTRDAEESDEGSGSGVDGPGADDEG
jgi:hypothetical protein